MENRTTGLFAISKAGHDKGNLYIIVREDEEYVYLADGNLKLLNKPKKKNRKHIQVINKKATDIIADEIESKSDILDSDILIKRAIKLYRREGGKLDV